MERSNLQKSEYNHTKNKVSWDLLQTNIIESVIFLTKQQVTFLSQAKAWSAFVENLCKNNFRLKRKNRKLKMFLEGILSYYVHFFYFEAKLETLRLWCKLTFPQTTTLNCFKLKLIHLRQLIYIAPTRWGYRNSPKLILNLRTALTLRHPCLETGAMFLCPKVVASKLDEHGWCKTAAGRKFFKELR